MDHTTSNNVDCGKKSERSQQHRRFVGVRQRRSGRWVAEIKESTQRVRLWLGTFDSEEEAAKAYDEASLALRGPNARTNFPIPKDVNATEHVNGRLIRTHLDLDVNKNKGTTIFSFESTDDDSRQAAGGIYGALKAKLEKADLAAGGIANLSNNMFCGVRSGFMVANVFPVQPWIVSGPDWASASQRIKVVQSDGPEERNLNNNCVESAATAKRARVACSISVSPSYSSSPPSCEQINDSLGLPGCGGSGDYSYPDFDGFSDRGYIDWGVEGESLLEIGGLWNAYTSWDQIIH